MAKIPGLDDLRKQRQYINDIATKLDSIVSSMSNYRKQVGDTAEQVRDLTGDLDRQVTLVHKQAEQGIYDQKSVDLVISLSKEMDTLEKKSRKLVGVTETLGKGFDKLGKGMQKVWATGIVAGIDLLIDGIHRVYDLEERWAKVTGEVNQKLGKLSPSMKVFWKESRQAESAIRGLGGELGDGTKMFAEFTAGFNKMDTQGFGKLGIQLSQGFDLGAESSGKFLRTLDNLDFDERKGEASEFMKSVTIGAKTAGVSVNALAKDFSESANFVARFGKEGAKALTKSAAYLKQFNVSLKDTEKLMDKFDTFDSAADSVAKLNVVFGTSINALNTMLEQDPAKRFEQIRQAMLAQGKTWEKLTYFERKAFTTTTGLTEDQAAAMLDVKNAGKSYAKFQQENAANAQKEASAQKMMQQQLKATAKTLYNFGAAADRITVAIANAIKPFTDLLGLTKSSDKQWKSFGQVMEGITQKIILFFNTLAKNRQWKEFMEKAADLTKKVAGYVADFFSPDKLGRNIDRIISAMKTFAKVSGAIIALWAGSKVFGGITSAVGLTKDIGMLRGSYGAGSAARGALSGLFPAGASKSGQAISSIAGPKGGLGIGGKMGLGGLAGGAAGAGIGSLFGATAGGGIGGGVGGMIGSIFGPIGTLIGTAVGTAAGIAIQKLMADKKMDAAQERLQKAQERLAATQDELSMMESKYSLDKRKREIKDDTIGKIVEKGKKKGLTLSNEEREALAERLQDMKSLGINTRSSDEALRKLADPSSGPISLSTQQIGNLNKASTEYNKTLADLDKKTQNFMDTIANDQSVKLARQQTDVEKQQLDLNIKKTEQQIEASKKDEKWYQKSDKRRALENKLHELQIDKLDIETRATNLEDRMLKQQKTLYELRNLQELNPQYQSKLKEANGDISRAIELFTAAGGNVSPDTVNFVKAQARTARGVGPAGAGMTFEPDVVSKGSSSKQEVHLHTHTYIDSKEVAHSVTKTALTNGH